MNNDTSILPPSQPLTYKTKIRIGIPPAPRKQGDWMIFVHLPKRVRMELKARGWKFYIIHMESIGQSHDANGRGAV